jgi:hypothetical protein
MSHVNTTIVHGEPSVSIASDTVTAWMTLRGNHIAPVQFRLATGDVEPYSLAPWQPGAFPGTDPLLDVLRGDFWCLPFGAQPAGPLHGETSCGRWTLTRHDKYSALLTLHAPDVRARVAKTVSVRDGQAALFQELTVSGLEGTFSYGTHPILDLSALPVGTARISSSPTRWAAVYPGVFADPAVGETQILQPGAEFDDLSVIERMDGGTLDLSRYPTSPAHEDLVMLTQRGDEHHLGWTAVSAPGYTWFALKDVRDFPSTVLWVSNGGRTQSPWLGRHTGRLGVEDVCSYFHEGLVASREDRLAHQGIATARPFIANVPTTLRTLQATTATPAGFGRVREISPASETSIRISDDAGVSVTCDLDWRFVLRSA